ncbi:hypothetical protein [Hymenobacter ruber]
MDNQPNTLSAANNVLAPAFYLLQEQGYAVSYDATQEWWIARKGELRFLAYSTIELCGLIYIYEQKGDEWAVSDDKINEFLKID